jgi:hypothetical protein
MKLPIITEVCYNTYIKGDIMDDLGLNLQIGKRG